ncbi:MAG: hypothetical protein NTW52_00220, partial [Planctomycetota bacterium]|nr:hypothetical protein [Planctomycetota bacterium]
MEYKICERDIRKWGGELERIRARIGHLFARHEIRERAFVYLRVSVSMIPRKNGWQVAEYAGDATPKNIQHFLGRSQWDADELRNDLQQYVTDHLGQDDGVGAFEAGDAYRLSLWLSSSSVLFGFELPMRTIDQKTCLPNPLRHKSI